MLYFQTGRSSIWDWNRYIQYPKSSSMYVKRERTTTTFVRHLNISLLPAYFKNRIPFLNVTMWTSYIGKTSRVTEVIYSNPFTNETLATGFLHLVHVDFQTRKPVPISQDNTEYLMNRTKYQIPHKIRTAPPTDFIQSPKPDDVFSYTALVVSSDTDTNQHLNTSNFIRFCMDAGSDAACKGRLSIFKKDLVYYDIQMISQIYLGEALINDQVIVQCWQDESDVKWLNFDILNRSKIICKCQIKFSGQVTAPDFGPSTKMSKL